MSRLKEQLVFAHQVDIYYHKNQFHIKALFSSKKICKMDTIARSFVFDKYCLIMD